MARRDRNLFDYLLNSVTIEGDKGRDKSILEIVENLISAKLVPKKISKIEVNGREIIEWPKIRPGENDEVSIFFER